MKRGILFLVFILWAAAAHADSFWDSLWHNADQQGERLMQQGDAAAAAQTYRDPRHKAYAELKAGDYANAVKHFSAFDDSDGNYNRGNALAQAGQLKEALKAYDAALAQNPDDKDAQHNRDLVAKALQQQPPQPQASSDKSPSSNKDKNGDKKQPGQSGQSDNKNSSDKNAGKQNDAKNGPGKQNSSGQHQNGKQQQGKEGDKNKQQAGKEQQSSSQHKQADINDQPGTAAQNKQNKTDEAEQARRDAAAALDKTPADKTRAPADAPPSEKQLAQEKWLRAIPDDPGGLLRRKFMIEHMIRQQGGQQ